MCEVIGSEDHVFEVYFGKEAGIESIKDYTRVKTTWFYTSDEPSLDPFSIR